MIDNGNAVKGVRYAGTIRNMAVPYEKKTIGEEIDFQISVCEAKILSLKELKEKLASPAGILCVSAEDLSGIMRY